MEFRIFTTLGATSTTHFILLILVSGYSQERLDLTFVSFSILVIGKLYFKPRRDNIFGLECSVLRYQLVLAS